MNEMKLLMQKRGRNIEELNDKGWITDAAFVVGVTPHLNNQNKELQRKLKLITEMYDNIKAFKFKASTVGKRAKTAWTCSLSAAEISWHYLSSAYSRIFPVHSFAS
jgi:hypothetical protein